MASQIQNIRSLLSKNIFVGFSHNYKFYELIHILHGILLLCRTKRQKHVRALTGIFTGSTGHIHCCTYRTAGTYGDMGNCRHHFLAGWLTLFQSEGQVTPNTLLLPPSKFLNLPPSLNIHTSPGVLTKKIVFQKKKEIHTWCCWTCSSTHRLTFWQ